MNISLFPSLVVQEKINTLSYDNIEA